MPLTLAEALKGLGSQTAGYLASQQTTPGRFDTGAMIRADWDVDDPGGTTGLVALALWTHLLRQHYPQWVDSAPNDATLAERARLALDYLAQAQRPSGLTDLRDCNYDSSPDAGFILQAILPPLQLARNSTLTGDWAEIVDALTRFARKMTVGACTGGFHTPNHRWVIAGGLHLAGSLFPDIAEVAPTIDAYLAEGVDLDEDGFYIERSAGVYDAICARSLLLMADRPDGLALRQAVERNLRADLALLNADGTIETGLSLRQDALSAASPPLASNLAAPYLLAHIHRTGSDVEKDISFARLAQWLWDRTPLDRRDYYGMSQVLIAHGEPAESGEMPALPSVVRHFPKNGLWRMRRGPLSISVFRNTPNRLLNFRYGAAFLAGISINQSYFGVGQFQVDKLEVLNGEPDIHLVSHGTNHPYRPGYDQPLGVQVAPETWQETRARREIRRVPPAASALTLKQNENGLQAHYQTLVGMDRVTAQIAFDFPAGGVWETEDSSFEPVAGQVIFLKSGSGTMRYGNDAIRIGPGANAHRMARMRDATPAGPGLVRVLMTFVTPIDHAFTISGGSWPDM